MTNECAASAQTLLDFYIRRPVRIAGISLSSECASVRERKPSQQKETAIKSINHS